MSESQTERELWDLQAENHHLRKLLSLLGDLSLRISARPDLAVALQEVVDTACELLGARRGALIVFDSASSVQQFVTHGVPLEERERIGCPPQGQGLSQWLQNVLQPPHPPDLTRHPDRPAMRPFLDVPLRHANETLGNIYLTGKTGGEEFTPGDESLLNLFAGQIALAIHSALLRQGLAAQRNRMDVFLSNSPDAIVFVDAATGQVQPNRRAEELLALPSDPNRGVADLEGKLFAADHAEASPIARALQGQRIDGEWRVIVRPDGAELCVVCSAAPIQDSAGRVTGAVLQLQDMTSVKAAQRQIEDLAAERATLLDLAEQERKRLRVLVDTSPVGVFLADAATGEMLLVNREAQRILGIAHQPGDRLERYEHSLMYRRPDGTAYLPSDLPLHRAILRGETVRAEEVRMEFPDGHSVLALVNAAPVYSAESGQITAGISVIQDMTPLEELEKLRNEFLGIVSHELRTPLTAIKGSAATVLGSHRPLDDIETREFFQIIDEQADRLRDMVDNLLDMTRIEAGSMSVIAGPIDLREVLQEAQEVSARSGTPQEITLQVPDDLPQVNADRRRVGQVLMNLLNNAAKFSPATAPVTIAVEHDEVHVTVHVQDQGRGIARESLPHLFKKFSQVHDNGSGQRLAGSGLGLAISKGIVEAHGGRIWVDSPGEGQGATFSFSLPVAAKSPPAPPPDTSRRAEHQGRVSRAGERTRILTVDDEPRILRYLQRSLNEAGYQVTVTGDPRDVIKLVELEEPDLVLLDLVLPGSSGFDLLQRIREFSGVPVIFLTARDRDEDMVQALKMGADDYITKPFSPSELLARIEAALRRRLLPDRIEARPSFVLDDLIINFASRSVLVDGKAVSLSATEYKVLYELASHAGMVLTHDQILQRVWGPEYAGETELVRSFIRNLRRKLGDDARNPRYIFTEPQVGYRVPKPQP